MNRVETITWLPFPENKPVPDGKDWRRFLTTNKQPNGLFVNRNAYYFASEQWEYDEELFPVIAYAELPKGYDPAAPLNFLTALAFARIGKTVKSCVDAMYHIDVDGKMICLLVNGDTITDETFTLAEIEGEWELV